MGLINVRFRLQILTWCFSLPLFLSWGIPLQAQGVREEDRNVILFRLLDEAEAAALKGEANRAIDLLRQYYRSGARDLSVILYDRVFDPFRDLSGFKELYKEVVPDSVVTFRDILKDLASGGSNGWAYYENKVISVPGDRRQMSVQDEAKIFSALAPPSLKMGPADSVFSFANSSILFNRCRFSTSGLFEGFVWGFMDVSDISILDCKGFFAMKNIRVDSLKISTSEFAGIRNSQVDGKLKLIFNVGQLELNGVRLSIGTANSIEHDGDALLIFNSVISGVKDDAAPDLKLLLDVAHFQLRNTFIDANLEINGRVEGDVRMFGNTIHGAIDITRFRFSETDTEIPFQQFEDAELVNWTDGSGDLRVSKTTADDFAGDVLQHRYFYDAQVAILKRLYDVYRRRADLESANICYQRMKDLEILYLANKPDRSWEETMRLWLNRTMGFYTNHATSPGKALMISLMIMLAFGVFYMFFPSDWDRESKARLLEELRSFRSPEPGQPRRWSVWGSLLLALANSFTLSLNAFVTLGFGNIPTSGLARYLCIAEGALGWFLLTLFSVALINQVLI